MENFAARAKLPILGKSIFSRFPACESPALVHASSQAPFSRRKEEDDDAVAGRSPSGRQIDTIKKQAKTTLDEITALVVRELKREGTLRLTGLGIFRKRRTKARMGRTRPPEHRLRLLRAHGCALHRPRR